MSRLLTSSQTVGPFFHEALTRPGLENLVTAETRGERITFEGVVSDGDGEPVMDAMIEIWQSDAGGHHPTGYDAAADPAFRGFGRSRTDAHGRYAFHTVFPGSVPDDAGGLQAPHILVLIFARGLLHHLVTRAYFADHPSNESDRVLVSVSDAAARRTLFATEMTTARDRTFRFDVRLQGQNETVFFDL